MESVFNTITSLPSAVYYVGGILIVVFLYQRYDENNRYNQKSGPIAPPKKALTATPSKVIVENDAEDDLESESDTSTTKIKLTSGIVDFLKSYGTQTSWSSWAIKQLFPEELLEELRDAALKGRLKEGDMLVIKNGKWKVTKDN